MYFLDLLSLNQLPLFCMCSDFDDEELEVSLSRTNVPSTDT